MTTKRSVFNQRTTESSFKAFRTIGPNEYTIINGPRNLTPVVDKRVPGPEAIARVDIYFPSNSNCADRVFIHVSHRTSFFYPDILGVLDDT